MIDVRNLKKSFGDHQVLAGIDEHIYPGEKVVVIGPSGSGKSTFLRCLNLLEEPTEGTITVDGVDITDPKVDIDSVRRKMGMVFQQFNLFPHLTIRDNIKLAPVTLKLMSDAEADKKAMELLGTNTENTIFIGDQLFTDIYGAKRAGIRNILVKPIDPKEEIQIVLKRYLEKIVLYFYHKEERNS